MRTKMPQVDYCASKFACVGLDEALRVETLVQVIPARFLLFLCLSASVSLDEIYVCNVAGASVSLLFEIYYWGMILKSSTLG